MIREIEVDNAASVEAKVRRARAAQPAWAAHGYEARAVTLLDFVDGLERDLEECAAITTSEMGKPITQARNEIRAVRERVEYFVERVPRVAATRAVTTTPELEESISYDPAGVVAHVSAWNYPYFVALNSIAPALLAGNAVVYKPSELASLTGLRITDLLHAAGVPVDIFQAAIGGGETGAALVESDVDVVCFTGSFATGRRVAAAAAERLARVQLELGGKDPAYVCDDVDIARPPRPSPRACSTTQASRAARSNASTCTRRSTTTSSPRSSRRHARTFPATRPTTTPASVRSRESSSPRCSPRRLPTPPGAAPASRSKAGPSTGREASSRRSCSSTSTTR